MHNCTSREENLRQTDASKTLQERVMQLLGHPRALIKNRLEMNFRLLPSAHLKFQFLGSFDPDIPSGKV
jgi:hypothetical protein